MAAPILIAAAAALGLLVLAGKRKSSTSDGGGGGTPTPPVPTGGSGTPKPPSPAPVSKAYTISSSDTPNSVANKFLTTTTRLAELNPGLNWKDFHITVRESFSGRRNDSVDESLHPVDFSLTGRVNTEEWPVYHTAADGGGYYYFPDGYDAVGRATDTRFGRIYNGPGGLLNKYVLGWKSGISIQVPSAPDADT